LAGSARAAETPPLSPAGAGYALGAVRSWVGRNGTDKIEGRRLWEDPTLRPALQAVLGPERFKHIAGEWTLIATKIVEVAPLIIRADLCKNHDCADNGGTFFFDLRSNTLQACWRERGGGVGKTSDAKEYWLATNKRPRPLDNFACIREQGGADSGRLFALYGR
jgi:hypothetical protein